MLRQDWGGEGLMKRGFYLARPCWGQCVWPAWPQCGVQRNIRAGLVLLFCMECLSEMQMVGGLCFGLLRIILRASILCVAAQGL